MRNKTHGSGEYSISDFMSIGEEVILERGVMVFHPEHIRIGDNVYVGHNTILKGYYKNMMVIGDHTWIGQQCFLHSGGGLRIGVSVGIGPKVTVLTSQHHAPDRNVPVYLSPIDFSEVVLENGCDIGAGSIILPGVTVGEGAIIGAGSVVKYSVPAYEIWAGVPASRIGVR